MAISPQAINAEFYRYFGRNAKAEEMDYWTKKNPDELSNAVRGDVRVQRVFDAFKKYRGREPNPEEMATYVGAAKGSGWNDVLQRDFVESDENITTDTTVPSFEDTDFFKRFMSEEGARRQRATDEFQQYYDDLILDAQGDADQAKQRLIDNYNIAIGVGDIEAADLIERLNEGLEERSSYILDDYRTAYNRASEDKKREIEQKQKEFQSRGLYFSGQKQEDVGDIQDVYQRQQQDLESNFERALNTGGAFQGRTYLGRTAKEQSKQDLQDKLNAIIEGGMYGGQQYTGLKQQRQKDIGSEFSTLQTQARKAAFRKYLAKYPGVSTTYSQLYG